MGGGARREFPGAMQSDGDLDCWGGERVERYEDSPKSLMLQLLLNIALAGLSQTS